jgi:TolA-binding protein
MFKEMWNALLGLESRPAFALSLDEQRALYAFFIGHAHPSKSMRQALDAARRGAHDEKACLGVAEAEQSATEAWRLERIARIGAIDPAYPTEYARGIASYRQGQYKASAQAFRRWLNDHPDGPLTLRAENYLRAAVDASRVE